MRPNLLIKEDSDIILKEYEAVKVEIADSIKARNQILSFGLAIAALIVNSIVIIINKDGYKPLGELLLLGILPTLSIAILLIWLGELERMIRAGNFILSMEITINEILGRDILRWEHTRRTSKIKIGYAYISVIGVFCAIALLPLILLFLPDNKIPGIYFLYAPIITIVFVVFFLYRYFKFIRTNDSLEVKVH